MKSIGLTGGIASGKSTVAAILRSWGYRVISADDLAHQAIAKGTIGYEMVVKEFGKGILGVNGEVDRKALGKIVFSDQASREWLEQLIHPIVIAGIKSELAQANLQDLMMIIFEVPLLFEVGLCDLFDVVWVVSVDSEIQLRRICQRDQLTEAQAKQRVESQISTHEKVSRADAVIYNNLGQKELETQVRELLKTLE